MPQVSPQVNYLFAIFLIAKNLFKRYIHAVSRESICNPSKGILCISTTPDIKTMKTVLLEIQAQLSFVIAELWIYRRRLFGHQYFQTSTICQ
jgi:hypothetical protein